MPSEFEDEELLCKYIGIITPFKLQESFIKKELQKKNLSSDIEVGTVHAFQSREKPVIIISTVRSHVVENVEGTTLGLLTNQKVIICFLKF